MDSQYEKKSKLAQSKLKRGQLEIMMMGRRMLRDSDQRDWEESAVR